MSNPIKKSFKEENTFESRLVLSSNVRRRYPDRLPVIVESAPSSKLPVLERSRYLVPHDITFGHFQHAIRGHLSLSSETAIFLFINNVLPPTAGSLSVIYERYKDPDGFLYVLYAGEDTFGSER